MSATADRFNRARAALDDRDDPARLHLFVASDEAWRALPLRSRLRVLLGDARRALGFAVWEIRSAAAEAVQERRGVR